MEDPTRIPRVLEELRTTWEGQPNISLPTLFGILANRGVAWGTTDEELIAALREEALRHPADLPRDESGRATTSALVTTTNPDLRVTCTPTEVIVRAASESQRQPGVWGYAALRPTGPGRLLVLTDHEGTEHKLGIVTLITVLDDENTRATTLDGLGRADRDNREWLITTTDGRRHVLGHSLSTWDAQRRHVDTSTKKWTRVATCSVGQPLVVDTPQGQEELGIVDTVVLLED